jgi:hypothetical protein
VDNDTTSPTEFWRSPRSTGGYADVYVSALPSSIEERDLAVPVTEDSTKLKNPLKTPARVEFLS